MEGASGCSVLQKLDDSIDDLRLNNMVFFFATGCKAAFLDMNALMSRRNGLQHVAKDAI